MARVPSVAWSNMFCESPQEALFNFVVTLVTTVCGVALVLEWKVPTA